jgi:hypothetical protein
MLPLSDEHRDILSTWILDHRADRKRFPAARRNPFSLSTGMVNRCARAASAKSISSSASDIRPSALS